MFFFNKLHEVFVLNESLMLGNQGSVIWNRAFRRRKKKDKVLRGRRVRLLLQPRVKMFADETDLSLTYIILLSRDPFGLTTLTTAQCDALVLELPLR